MSMFDDFSATAVDEGMDPSDHMGQASMVNQATSAAGMTPTRCLALLWFVVLGLYWACGWAFAGQRS